LLTKAYGSSSHWWRENSALHNPFWILESEVMLGMLPWPHPIHSLWVKNEVQSRDQAQKVSIKNLAAVQLQHYIDASQLTAADGSLLETSITGRNRSPAVTEKGSINVGLKNTQNRVLHMLVICYLHCLEDPLPLWCWLVFFILALLAPMQRIFALFLSTDYSGGKGLFVPNQKLS
jgi:hypothetical protein